MTPTLYVLGSGSRGNSLALEADGAVLLIDAGFSGKEIERRAAQVGLDLGRAIGVLLTHEHGDHAGGAPRLLRQRGIPVLSSEGTWYRLKSRLPETAAHHPVRFRAPVTLGPFEIDACPVSHDASEPMAVAVRVLGQSIGIAYDLGRPTSAVRYLLRDCAALVLEANHDDVLLRTSGYPPVVQQRIAGAGGHLSNRACAELVQELLHPGLTLLVLAHLSARCNNEACARATVEPVLRKARWRGRLHVARQDDPLEPMAVYGSPVLTLGI